MARDISVMMDLPLDDGTGEVVEVAEKEKVESEKAANEEIDDAVEIVDEINSPKGVEVPEEVPVKELTEKLILRESLDTGDYFNFTHDLFKAVEKVCRDWAKVSDIDGDDILAALDEVAIRVTDVVDEFLEEGLKPKKPEKVEEDFKVIRPLDSFEPWSGAIQTWSLIKDANKLDELDSLLEEVYPEGLDETELNDLLWFEPEWILESLGISDEDMYSNED